MNSDNYERHESFTKQPFTDLSSQITEQDTRVASSFLSNYEVNGHDALIEQNFVQKHFILDIATPLREEFCARFKRSFAFRTFWERAPKLLQEMVMDLRQNESNLIAQYGDYVHFDLIRILWSLELLEREILENRKFLLFYGKAPDTEDWNKFLQNLTEERSQWFSSTCLYAECYMYRRIWAIFRRSETLSKYDYFGQQKKMATRNIVYLLLNLLRATRGPKRSAANLQAMLKLSLWGDRCDLSVTREGMMELVKQFDKDLLADQSDEVWKVLTETSLSPVYVDIVCEDVGYELFNDLLLAEYLIETGLARCVRFHVKVCPWFTWGVTHNDFRWMLRFLACHAIPEMAEFGRRLRDFLRDRSMVLCPSCYFWTQAYEFSRMKKILPCLYVQLSEATLVIFKGDLNYRKLLGEINWDPTTNFAECLRGFMPTSVCALRVIKSDICSGLPICCMEWLNEDNPDWIRMGEKAIIQVAIKPRP